MDSRLYFVLGDLFSCILVGAVVGWISCVAFAGWNMWLAMIVAMPLGMLLATLLWFPLGIIFGAMEVMIPTMFSGMASGMLLGMSATGSHIAGLLWGAIVGLACIVAVWILNNNLRGVTTLGVRDD